MCNTIALVLWRYPSHLWYCTRCYLTDCPSLSSLGITYRMTWFLQASAFSAVAGLLMGRREGFPSPSSACWPLFGGRDVQYNSLGFVEISITFMILRKMVFDTLSKSINVIIGDYLLPDSVFACWGLHTILLLNYGEGEVFLHPVLPGSPLCHCLQTMSSWNECFLFSSPYCRPLQQVLGITYHKKIRWRQWRKWLEYVRLLMAKWIPALSKCSAGTVWINFINDWYAKIWRWKKLFFGFLSTWWNDKSQSMLQQNTELFPNFCFDEFWLFFLILVFLPKLQNFQIVFKFGIMMKKDTVTEFFSRILNSVNFWIFWKFGITLDW